MTSMLKDGVSGPHGGPTSAPSAKIDAANAATPSATNGSERMPLSPPLGRFSDTFDRRGRGRNRSSDVFRAGALLRSAECGANRARAAPHPELVVDVLEV